MYYFVRVRVRMHARVRARAHTHTESYLSFRRITRIPETLLPPVDQSLDDEPLCSSGT